MSSSFYNKLKSIENSRQELAQILIDKGLSVSSTKSLGGLVSNVSRLNLYETVEEDWDGITPEEEPTNYYKGDTDWKDLIDLNEILANDTASYSGKAIFLIRCSDNPRILKTNNTSMLSGFSAYKFSDGDGVYTSLSHTWDSSKDIVSETGNRERFRYIIAYTNSTTAVTFWHSYYFTPEAVIYYSGTYRAICLSDFSGSLTYYTSDTGTSTSTVNCSGDSYGNYPKYFEVKPRVITNVVFSGGRTDDRIKTIKIDGYVKDTIGAISGYELGYLKVTNSNLRYQLGNISYCSNPDIHTYIKINTDTSKLYQPGSIGSITYTDNTYIEINQCNNLGSIGNNINTDFKIGSITGTMSGYGGSTGYDYYYGHTTFNSYTESDTHFDISSIHTIADYCFGFSSANIKIGVITGSVGACGFYGCKKLCKNLVFRKRDADTNANTYSISESAFCYSSVESVDMGDSNIATINSSNGGSNRSNMSGGGNGIMNHPFAFSNLRYLKLGNLLKTINYYCFSDCDNLESVSFGENLTSILDRAFYNCFSLKSITIPDSITSFGTSVFLDCRSLETINIGTSNLTTLPTECFSGLKSLRKVTLPANLTQVPDNCFSNCYNLHTLVLPDTVTTIGSSAFSNCYSLVSVTQDTPNIITINSSAFSGCTSLSEIFSLEKVTTYGSSVFYDCNELVIKLIGEPLTISNDAFTYTNSYFDLSDYEPIANINVTGCNWSIQTFLTFLELLPNRTGKTVFTITLGESFLTRGSNQSFYPLISSNYVKEIDGHLVFLDAYETGAQTIASYVSNKNWTMA